MSFRKNLSKVIDVSIWMLWFGVVFVPVLWSLIGAFEYWDIDQAAVAAWIQAVGSIAAIASGVVVLQYQTAEKNRDRAASDAKLTDRIIGIVVHVSAIFDPKDPSNNFYDDEVGSAKRLESRLKSTRELLREVKYTELPTQEIAVHWLEWRQAIDDLLAHFDSYGSRPDDQHKAAHTENFIKAWGVGKRASEALLKYFQKK